MPQLDLVFFKENIIFTLLSFGFFYSFLYHFVVKKFFLISKKREEFFHRIKANIDDSLKEIEILTQKISIKQEQNNESLRVLTLLKNNELLDYKVKKQQEFNAYKEQLMLEFDKGLLADRNRLDSSIADNFSKLFNLIKKSL